MSKPLIVKEAVETKDGDTYYVECSFDLPTIIGAGYAPDDVIEYVVKRCVLLYQARETLRDIGLELGCDLEVEGIESIEDVDEDEDEDYA